MSEFFVSTFSDRAIEDANVIGKYDYCEASCYGTGCNYCECECYTNGCDWTCNTACYYA